MAKRFRLGVLFIHGIGTQSPGATLVQWGDQLLRVIARATGRVVEPRVERAEPGEADGSEPAEAIVRFHPGDEEWLLAEACWADTFPPPTYRELVSWSIRAVPWALAIHIAQRYWQTFDTANRRRTFLARSGAVLQLLLALALVPLVILVLMLTMVLGLLPIPQLRSVILSAQSVLTGTMGDSLAFVESPLRAALIRTRILKTLERLIGQCDHTVVVAHSQGAAAVLDALGGIADANAPPEPAGPVPDTLLTFGAGINQLVSLKVLSRGLPGTIPGNPAYLGVIALLGTVAMVTWLVRDLRAGLTTMSAVFQAAAVLASAFALICAVFVASKRWLTKAVSARADSGRKKSSPQVLIPSVAVVAIIGIAFYYSDRHNLPLGTVNLLLFAILMAMASLALILSSEIKEAVTAPVREPTGLTRWVDLHASADPVPNGPTRIRQAKVLTSIAIWNRGSVMSDHTAYWQNLDGFVLRVARVCAEAARSSWLAALPPETRAVDRRAAWRLSFLRLATWTTTVAWFMVLAILWSQHGPVVALPIDIPTWVPFGSSPLAQWTLAPALVTAAAWLTSSLLFSVWALWTRSEQEATLSHAPQTSTVGAPVYAMGIIVSLVWLLPIALARGNASTVLESMTADPGAIGALALSWGVLLSLLALWRLPPPND